MSHPSSSWSPIAGVPRPSRLASASMHFSQFWRWPSLTVVQWRHVTVFPVGLHSSSSGPLIMSSFLYPTPFFPPVGGFCCPPPFFLNHWARSPRVFCDEFVTKFFTKFGDEFSESPNLVKNLVTKLVTNVVMNCIRWQKQWQNWWQI